MKENNGMLCFPRQKGKASRIVNDPPCYSEDGVCPTPFINCVDCERKRTEDGGNK